jgi:hypothetical protein
MSFAKSGHGYPVDPPGRDPCAEGFSPIIVSIYMLLVQKLHFSEVIINQTSE